MANSDVETFLIVYEREYFCFFDLNVFIPIVSGYGCESTPQSIFYS